MREIKFRAWHKVAKCMIAVGKISFPAKKVFAYTDDQDWALLEDVKISDIMQFTGLLDKNGKEIYEGDIVCVSGNINCFKERGEVIFEYGCFFFSGKRFTPKHLTMYPRDLLCECQTTFYTKNTPPEKPLTKFLEVIGNIYENPDLLTHPT